jgi:hypothetical protein
MTGASVLPAVLGLSLLFCVFMFARKGWVSTKVRGFNDDVSRLARRDINAGREWLWRYDNYSVSATYDRMMWKFWIWDAEHFRPESAKPADRVIMSGDLV